MIHPSTSYILTLPSEQQRLLQFYIGNITYTGKYGQFLDDQIIGKPFGTFQLFEGTMTKISNVEESWFDKMEVDDYTDKMQLLINNNQGFNGKTEHAKDKYIQKHNKKVKNVLRIMPITSQALCEYHFKRGPMAILQLNWDILAIMMTMGNVEHNGKYLCMDNARGLVVDSIYTRLDTGKVYQIMQTDGEVNDLAVFQKYSSTNYAKATWEKTFTKPEVWQDRYEMNDDLEKKKLRMGQRIEIRKEILKGEFSGIFLATRFDENPIIEKLLPLMGGCCQIVVYSPYLAKCSKTYELLRNHPEFCNVDMYTTHFREYQVLPHRTRPQMKSTSSGGGFVVATRIFE